MTQRGTKEGDELLARIVLRSALCARVTQHDDGSDPSMYDLDIEYPDGRRAAVEVVSTRDREALSLTATIVRTGYTAHSGLTRTWTVLVDPGTRVRDLTKELPGLLAGLERQGIARLRRTGLDPWPPRLRELGAVSCWSTDPTERWPGGFRLNAFPSAAWNSTGEEVMHATEQFLSAASDVAAKLLASGLPERHAAIVVTVDWLGVLSSILDGVLPESPPTLPHGVDCLC